MFMIEWITNILNFMGKKKKLNHYVYQIDLDGVNIVFKYFISKNAQTATSNNSNMIAIDLFHFTHLLLLRIAYC